MSEVVNRSDLDALVMAEQLEPWLDAHIPQLGRAKLKASIISGGTTNVIIALDRGGPAMVMRRPSADMPPGSAKTIEREARLLAALGQTAVPHPRVRGYSFDPQVIGCSFYVMDRIDGWAPELNQRNCRFQPPFDQPPLQAELANAMIDGLIALANVDYQAIGLADFGKPGGFLQRQVDRWGSQLESYSQTYAQYRPRDIPGLAEVAQWLRTHIPADSAPGILHGDYGFPNVMFQPSAPVKLAAMIDWELSTIGDPMLDVGWYLGGFRDARAPQTIPAPAYFDASRFPTRQELAQRYAQGTGRDISNLDYYLVLALYKAACILEYKVAAAMDGQIPAEMGQMFDRFVLDNASEALKISRWNP